MYICMCISTLDIDMCLENICDTSVYIYISIRRREAPMRQLSSQLQLSRLTASLAEFLVWVGLTWPGLNLSEPSSAMLLPFIL